MTEVLVSSTVLILALAALRLLLRGKIDPRLQYALWLLAALRLLLPVPLVSSPVSVMNAAADVPAAVQRLTAPEDRRAPQPAAEADSFGKHGHAERFRFFQKRGVIGFKVEVAEDKRVVALARIADGNGAVCLARIQIPVICHAFKRACFLSFVRPLETEALSAVKDFGKVKL